MNLLVLVEFNVALGMLGNKMKQDFQHQLYYYLCKLPVLKPPIIIHFTWLEKNKRRDLDNISAVGRKFILDTLQLCEKIPNDNLNYVVGFSDRYEKSEEYGVVMEIEEGVELDER